jgi:hypothetical protein
VLTPEASKKHYPSPPKERKHDLDQLLAHRSASTVVISQSFFWSMTFDH